MVLLLKFDINGMMYISININVIVSEIGAENRNKSIPLIKGKIIASGTSVIKSLNIDSKVALTGLPTAWKKIEVDFVRQVKVINDK